MPIGEQIIKNQRKINDLIERSRARIAAARDNGACGIAVKIAALALRLRHADDPVAVRVDQLLGP